jgi:hypothetical protein
MPQTQFFVSAAAVCVVAALTLTFCTSHTARAQTFAVKQRRQFVPGRRAVVIDDRLAALRAAPDIKAPLVQRLRQSRAVGIIGPARAGRGGLRFYPVAVTRNTRGWLVAEAVIRPRHAQDAARLMKLIEETDDAFARARLGRLCADEFRGMAVAPRALLALGRAAEEAAARLTRDARRWAGVAAEEAGGRLGGREYALNYVGLDRYNRLGVTFNYDETTGRIVYDGAAYRELVRKYPRSAEAKEARERLMKVKNERE